MCSSFCSLMMESATDIPRIFRSLDKNGDRFIDRAEMTNTSQSLDAFWADKRIDALIGAADVNFGGVIDYVELVSWACREDGDQDKFIKTVCPEASVAI